MEMKTLNNYKKIMKLGKGTSGDVILTKRESDNKVIQN